MTWFVVVIGALIALLGGVKSVDGPADWVEAFGSVAALLCGAGLVCYALYMHAGCP